MAASCHSSWWVPWGALPLSESVPTRAATPADRPPSTPGMPCRLWMPAALSTQGQRKGGLAVDSRAEGHGELWLLAAEGLGCLQHSSRCIALHSTGMQLLPCILAMYAYNDSTNAGHRDLCRLARACLYPAA